MALLLRLSVVFFLFLIVLGAYRFIVHFPERRTIFSQRDLVRFFYSKFSLFADKNITIAECMNFYFRKLFIAVFIHLIFSAGIGHAPVYSLKQTDITLHGLRKIRLKEVHAIAIVHEDTGKLVGCLSESDLRELTADTYASLFIFISLYNCPHVAFIQFY